MHATLKKYFAAALGRLLSDLSSDELRGLLVPGTHGVILANRRIGLITSRVRLVAALFAILTPLWTVIDLVVFNWPIWPQLAAMRLAASFAFGALALSREDETKPSCAYRELALMFAIPIVFFIVSHYLLSHYKMQGMAEAIATGYAFLPFVMVAGLSVFPLTAVEGMLYALPVLVVEIGVAASGMGGLAWSSQLGAVWLLLLIAVVATLAGMSQLSFMMALVRQAGRDALTSCFTRACGEELLEVHYKIAQRGGSPLAMVFVDLDNFKVINDVHGHEAGDLVLANAAQAMRRHLRASDILVRWGGEEFLLIMSNTGRDAAVEVIERLRGAGLGIRPDGQPVTASFGIAENLADKSASWRDLVDVADQRMYVAKQSGKNRWVAGDPD